ncbi:S1C family serine protease [Polaromonas sp. AER18D-145]|uniref:S1C family serine protease n=1 Tax=Polaromonas sp. AER18D-145 TaxID=1977060 RepID=UPI000BBC0535|nr:S1C family serine protease [Polaromonas sp. AER18D-145]
MCSLRRWTHPLVAAVLLAALPALSTTVPPPNAQEMIAALARANAAVVGVRVMVDEEARSAETLGQLRRGSGVVIAPDGLILTIGYLMLEAEQIEIVTQDNKTLPARAVAYDLATGFGLLRPVLPQRASSSVSAAVLGSSLPLQPGEALMAVTGPQASDDGEVSMTRLVSKRPFSGTWEYHIDVALFTSPPLLGNGANHSGAPLFNQKGELVGIGSLLVSDASGQNRALPGNMFVPVDLLRPILAEMQRSGSSAQSHRPWLGLNSIDQGGRIQIVRVSKDSPAELAGLEAGDVVLAVDGTKVATLADFYKKLWDRAAPDAEVALTVLQGADVKTIVLKAQDRLQTLKKPSGI